VRSPRRILALLVASAVLLAATTPCPPIPDAHLASSSDGSSDVGMQAKCPCSCNGSQAPRHTSTHLDFAVDPDARDAPLAVAWIPIVGTHRTLSAAPYAPLEPVPI
jgi:hypothetical protein